MDFETTRQENDQKLSGQLVAIRSADASEVLVPFAKAYLGMFYVIDSELPPKQKIRLLANEKLSDAILDGFKASLSHGGFPSARQIGAKMAVQQDYAIGYPVLAGMDLLAKQSLQNVENLADDILAAAVCFHFANKTCHQDIWLDEILAKQGERVASALTEFWIGLVNNGARYLPGGALVLEQQKNIPLVKASILALLEHWINCKPLVLREMLFTAFRYADHASLAALATQKIERDKFDSEVQRVYWYATAFLLAPELMFNHLSNYIGRVKQKVLPLLDYCIAVLARRTELELNINAMVLAQLLRIIAPIFPPQQHSYGEFGQIDVNSRNVMKLFYALACFDTSDVQAALRWLRKARVMKIYSGVLDSIHEIHMRKGNDRNFACPEFDEYVDALIAANKLSGRSNRFDLK